MLSIKLTDNSATKSGISLTHPYAERESKTEHVCERERKIHAALSCLLNHRHQRTIQIHRDGEHKRDTHAIHLLHNKQLKKINLHVYIKQKYHLCMIITLILIVLIKT